MNRLIHLIVVIVCWFLHLSSSAQNFTNESLLRRLAHLDSNVALTPAGRLQLLYEWKDSVEQLHLPPDSVYAKLLHTIGNLEFFVNKNYNVAIGFTLRALEINTTGKPGTSAGSAAVELYNLGFYHNKLNLLKKALLYYDQAIQWTHDAADIKNVMIDSRLEKANIFFRVGDYEKTIEECDLGISAALQRKDSLRYLAFLSQRAQSLFFQNKLPSALADVRIAIALGKSLHEPFYLASALKTEGFIFAKEAKYSMAVASFRRCIDERTRSKQFWQVAGDYNDLGNLYSNSMLSYSQATASYSTAFRYAKKEGDSIRMARISLNQGKNYFLQGNYAAAMYYHLQAMHYLKISKGADLTGNPTVSELRTISNKELIQILFNSKTELFLGFYKKTHDQKWLKACLQTALLNDSLISEVRHELLGDQSKLFWRDRTRELFINALEACYLANDHALAFYFMEKSRSVLLQDKLSELGASAFLPPDEAARQEKLQISIIELQERMSSFPDTSHSYRELRIQLIEARENLERYIRSLEAKYPYYYQYKYADNVKSLTSLQRFLLEKGQTFIDYLIEDTISFALCVTPHTTRLIKFGDKGQHMEDLLSGFLRTCSEEEALTKDFPGFLVQSNSIYKMLLQPFQLPEGRVIICLDNYLFPFEALSKDALKADFLVNSYSFSYVYSARWLMNQYEHGVGKGDFLGLAPVSFKVYSGLPDLKQSEDALERCSAFFSRSKQLVHGDASRRNFLQQVSDYAVTTIFTHARADSSGEEPLLFLNDSVIHLSELQILTKPATKLIVLSACETNVGKNLNGEGIFSLARGFSAAGIPSVAATQWQADEQAIYTITEKLNEFLSLGLNKDEALQKAKLFYINKKGSILPYYWADMILIGNTDPVKFSAKKKLHWPILLVALAVLAGVFIFVRATAPNRTKY